MGKGYWIYAGGTLSHGGCYRCSNCTSMYEGRDIVPGEPCPYCEIPMDDLPLLEPCPKCKTRFFLILEPVDDRPPDSEWCYIECTKCGKRSKFTGVHPFGAAQSWNKMCGTEIEL